MSCIDQQSKVYHHLDELDLNKLIIFFKRTQDIFIVGYIESELQMKLLERG